MIEWLTQSTVLQVLYPLHLFGVILGLGTATVADTLFLRFLKRGRLGEEALVVYDWFPKLLWTGVALLFVSGLGLLLPQWELLLQPNFLAKLTAFVVLTVNGLVLGVYISPALSKLSFHAAQESTPTLQKKRTLAFVLGGVSISSWYVAFIMPFLPRRLDIPQFSLLIAYVGLLIVVLLGGLVASKLVARYYSSSSNN